LIAISGLATAVGIKAALESGKASGKVVLFGTPAEGKNKKNKKINQNAMNKVLTDTLHFIELSIGKIVLTNMGAFQENVDVCLMLHPA
jgi:hypothetical protein